MRAEHAPVRTRQSGKPEFPQHLKTLHVLRSTVRPAEVPVIEEIWRNRVNTPEDLKRLARQMGIPIGEMRSHIEGIVDWYSRPINRDMLSWFEKDLGLTFHDGAIQVGGPVFDYQRMAQEDLIRAGKKPYFDPDKPDAIKEPKKRKITPPNSRATLEEKKVIAIERKRLFAALEWDHMAERMTKGFKKIARRNKLHAEISEKTPSQKDSKDSDAPPMSEQQSDNTTGITGSPQGTLEILTVFDNSLESVDEKEAKRLALLEMYKHKDQAPSTTTFPPSTSRASNEPGQVLQPVHSSHINKGSNGNIKENPKPTTSSRSRSPSVSSPRQRVFSFEQRHDFEEERSGRRHASVSLIEDTAAEMLEAGEPITTVSIARKLEQQGIAAHREDIRNFVTAFVASNTSSTQPAV